MAGVKTDMIFAPDGRKLFSLDELRCKGTGGMKLGPGFADALRDLRIDLDMPMIVTSCCRSKEYNDQIGGHRRSLHVFDEPHWPTRGCVAIDIAITSSQFKEKLIEYAWDRGWSVGIASDFIHLDRRVDIQTVSFEQTRFYY